MINGTVDENGEMYQPFSVSDSVHGKYTSTENLHFLLMWKKKEMKKNTIVTGTEGEDDELDFLNEFLETNYTKY